jgi:hypothetical protein
MGSGDFVTVKVTMLVHGSELGIHFAQQNVAEG